MPQAQQQQPHLQPGAAAPTLEAVPVPHIAADPAHMDRGALPQVRDDQFHHCLSRQHMHTAHGSFI